MTIKIFYGTIITIIISAGVLRFWNLDNIPYGYHVDEYSAAVTVQCLATEGVDAHLVPHPLFFNLNYGTPKPPVYTYPAALWAKAFGHKIDKLRAFTALGFTIGLIGLFFLSRLFFGYGYALITVLIASISPWAWVVSRVAYDSLFAFTFLSWGLFFFLRTNRIFDKITAGLLLSAAMYAYPPTRAQVPLMIPLLILFDSQRQKFSKKALLGFFLALTISAFPMIQKTLNGEIQGRFNSISIFSTDYLKSIGKTNSPSDIAQVFLNNYAEHLNPKFLFTNGDPSYVHSTRRFGIFGWVDTAGFAVVIILLLLSIGIKQLRRSNDTWFIVFCVLNFLIAIIPSGLTNSELPNSLRIIGGLPFTCMFAGYGLWRLCDHWRFFTIGVAAAGIIFTVVFLKSYFTQYPQESKGMFGFWTKEQAKACKTDQDWLKFMARYVHEDYHFRYYLMNFRGDTCKASREKWFTVRKLMGF